jgi:phosphonate transport system ATP-binding protein
MNIASSELPHSEPKVFPFHPTAPAVQVELEDVFVDYPDRPNVLRAISLTIRRGERVAIIGPSGSGKSTLLKTINGLLPLARGKRTIHLDSQDGDEYDHRNPSVAMIFQEFALAQRLPVLTNVLIGSLGRSRGWAKALGWFPASEKAKARKYLEEVGLKGYEQTRVDQLSSGQKQRVAIARALMQEREILLADEPVASLDPETAYSVLRLLARLHAELNCTLVLSLHEVEQAREFCDRVVGIREGRIVFDGAPSALTGKVLETIFSAHDVIELNPH